MTRFLEPLFQPLGILWAINVLAAIRFVFVRKWSPALFCGGTAAFLFAFGSTRLPNYLLATLERPYANQKIADLPEADAVVMLGGMLSQSESDTLGFQVSDAFDRALAALDLIRNGKAPVLVFGGGGGRKRNSESEPWRESVILERWLKTWNLPATNIVQLELAANTRDEALQVLDLFEKHEWNRVLLVTSGYHMRRAEALFKNLGIPATPVACDFVGLSSLANKEPYSPFPKANRFQILDLYLHELIGWYYYRIRNWI